MPKHYVIPIDPMNESVYALIRPKNDRPPPLFKSKYASTIARERDGIIAATTAARRKGVKLLPKTPSVFLGTGYTEAQGGDLRPLNKSQTGLHVSPSKNGARHVVHKVGRVARVAKAAEPTLLKKKTIKKAIPTAEARISEEVPEEIVGGFNLEDDDLDEVPEEIHEEEIQVDNKKQNKQLMLAGFKSDWNDLNAEFQRMPIVGNTRTNTRKAYLEKQLRLIEENMKRL